MYRQNLTVSEYSLALVPNRKTFVHQYVYTTIFIYKDLYSILYTVYSILHALYSILYTLYSILHNLTVSEYSLALVQI